MFTYLIFKSGVQVENLCAGSHKSENDAYAAGRAKLNDLCPPFSRQRQFYRLEVVEQLRSKAERMYEYHMADGFVVPMDTGLQNRLLDELKVYGMEVMLRLLGDVAEYCAENSMQDRAEQWKKCAKKLGACAALAQTLEEEAAPCPKPKS